MGRWRLTGKIPQVRAVQLRPTGRRKKEEEETELELPPWGVCCVCLKRITGEKENAAIHAGQDYIHLHSRLIRHNTEHCAPQGRYYQRAIPRLRAWGRKLQVEDQQAIAEMEAVYQSLRAETEKPANGKML